MKFIVIESGSKGNATLVYDDKSVILIDMGVSLRSLKNSLASIDKKLIDLNALLLTHNHSDHTKGIKYLNPLPIYCTEGTYDGLNIIEIKPFEFFQINNLNITALKTSHDAINSVGYLIKNDNEKLVYMTDTGMIPEQSLKLMTNADYYIIESNHNVKMLHQTNRPKELKLRILCDEGHLSNEDSAIYMSELVGNKTKQIVLAHLSEEANTPELALSAYSKIFAKCHLSLKNIEIKCANQHYAVCGGKNDEL